MKKKNHPSKRLVACILALILWMASVPFHHASAANDQVTIVITASPAHGGTVTGSGTYTKDSVVTITATPNSGWVLDGWYENGYKIGDTEIKYLERTSEDRTVEARFAQINQIVVNTVVYPSNAGSATGGGTFPSPQNVSLNATANSGWTFSHWSLDNTIISDDSSIVLYVSDTCTVEAHFTSTATPKQQITINLSASPSNGGTVTGGGTYERDTVVTISATPNAGWTFDGWYEYGQKIGDIALKYLERSSSDRQIEARFSPPDDGHIPVTNITGVPAIANLGAPLTLTGEVNPPNATNSAPIMWSVVNQGGTEAWINGDKLMAVTRAGNVTVRARINNGIANGVPYVQDFVIAIKKTMEKIIPVTSITGIPAAAKVGTPLTLTGTVKPSNATFLGPIIWSVVEKGSTGATINGSTLNTTADGRVRIRATIENGKDVGIPFTQDYNIDMTDTGYIPVTSITGVPTTTTSGTPLVLTAIIDPPNAPNRTINWNIVDHDDAITANISNYVLYTSSGWGSITVRATVPNGISDGNDYIEDFVIIVTQFPPEYIVIRTEKDLRTKLYGGAKSAGNYFIMANNIQLTSNWLPVEDFRGTFDGNGHVIENLNISKNRGTAGFIQTVFHGNVTIKNLGIHIGNDGIKAEQSGGITDNDNFAGGFIGLIDGSPSVTIENCYVKEGEISAYKQKVLYDAHASSGGFIGAVKGARYFLQISNSYSTCDIYAGAHISTRSTTSVTAYAGGLIGRKEGGGSVRIKNCFTACDIHTEASDFFNVLDITNFVVDRLVEVGGIGIPGLGILDKILDFIEDGANDNHKSPLIGFDENKNTTTIINSN